MGAAATSSFTGEPQPVEVFHRGVWYPGVLLGWRHEADGSCRVRIRCVVDGLTHTAWTDLTVLRLPVPASRPDVDPVQDTRPHRLVPQRHAPHRPPPPAATRALPRPRPRPWFDHVDDRLRPAPR